MYIHMSNSTFEIAVLEALKVTQEQIEDYDSYFGLEKMADPAFN